VRRVAGSRGETSGRVEPQQRYRRHRDKLFVFLERPDVPHKNNGSERDLRNLVVHRKVTGGFRSEWSPGVFATITTVVETARKRGQGALETLLTSVGSALRQVLTPRRLPVPGET
jgi:transposase